MNRRAFLGSGLMSLFVGVFALLMGGGLPRPKQREGKAVPIGGGEAELGITPAPDHLRILKPWDGKTIQEADYCGPARIHGGTGRLADERLSRELTKEEVEELAAKLAAVKPGSVLYSGGQGYAVYPSALPPALSCAESVSWDTPPKPTPLADMRRIHAPGRQFGLG